MVQHPWKAVTRHQLKRCPTQPIQSVQVLFQFIVCWREIVCEYGIVSEGDACVAGRSGVSWRDKWPSLSGLWQGVQRQEPAPVAAPTHAHPHGREAACLPKLSLPNQPEMQSKHARSHCSPCCPDPPPFPGLRLFPLSVFWRPCLSPFHCFLLQEPQR